jgi:DNA-binding XRE family transcriptional regulator
MTKESQQKLREWAQHLYIHQSKNQTEIAAIVGVTDATISNWCKEGAWKEMRQSVLTTRDAQLRRLYAQLDELNCEIIARAKGQRFANEKEAKVIMSLSTAIKSLETELSISDYMDTFKDYNDWLRGFDLSEAQRQIVFHNQFINSKLGK